MPTKLMFLRKALPYLASLFIVIAGFTGVFIHLHQQQKQLIDRSEYDTLRQLNSLLTIASTLSLASSALIEANVSCQVAAPVLMSIDNSLSTIDDINLIKNDDVYCTSKPGVDIDLIMAAFHNASTKHNYVNFVLYKSTIAAIYQKEQGAVFVILNPQTIDSALTSNNSFPEVASYLNKQSNTDNQANMDLPQLHLTDEESFNNFSKVFSRPTHNFISVETFLEYRKTILSILAIAILVYLIGKWASNNLFSPYFELTAAIKNKHIKAYVQPIYLASNNDLIGVEVLARWHHPQEGLIMPNTFIPMAERTGLIIPMTQLLLKQLGTELAPYAKSVPEGFHVGFNISSEHCKSLDLVDDVKKLQSKLNSNKITLVIEITERELIEVTDITKELFKQLHELNTKIALDDFGVGNSNLTYLRDFSIDYLKIDRSFVSRIGSDALSINILDSIIEIAQNCNLQSCAEGVETEEQAQYLREKGVDFLQGYFYSKPVPLKTLLISTDFKKILR